MHFVVICFSWFGRWTWSTSSS